MTLTHAQVRPGGGVLGVVEYWVWWGTGCDGVLGVMGYWV
jgi:hypothetical protein